MNFYLEVFAMGVTYLIMCICGLPALLIIEGKRMEKYRYVTMPVMGYSFVMLALYYCFRMGIPIKISTYIVVPLFLCLDYFLIYSKTIIITHNDIKRIMCTFGSILIAGFFLLSPLIIANESICSLGYENADWGNYGAMAGIIKNAGYTDTVNGGWVCAACFESQTRGSVLIVAFLSTIFHFSVWEALDISFAFLFLLVVITGSMLGNILGGNKYSGLLSGIFVFFNCGYIYLVMEAFFGQISSIPFLILATVYLIYDVVYDQGKDKISIKKGISLGIISATMLLTYMEMVPFLGFLYIVVLVALFFSSKQKAYMLFKELLIALLVTSVLFTKGLIAFPSVTFRVADLEAGWNVPVGGLLQALGIYNVYLETLGVADFVKIPLVITAFISFILSIIILVFTLRTYRGVIRSVIASVLIAYGLLYFLFLLKFRSYQVFKGLVSIQYIYVVVFANCCASRICKLKERRLFSKVTSIMAIIFSLLVIITGMDFYERSMMRYGKAIGGDSIYNLGMRLEEDDDEELQLFFEPYRDYKVFVRMTDISDGCEALVAAVEAGVPVNQVSDDDGYLWWNTGLDVGDEKYLLVESNVFRDPLENVGNILFINDTFLVKEMDAQAPLWIEHGGIDSSIYSIDEDGFAHVGRNVNESNTYIYRTNSSEKSDMNLSFYSDYNRDITISLNDFTENVIITPGDNKFVFEGINIEAGDNILSIVAENSENNGDMWLTNLSINGTIGEVEKPVKINSVRIGEGISGKIVSRIIDISNASNFIKTFAETCDYRIGFGETLRLSFGIINDNINVQKKMFGMCKHLDVVEIESDTEYLTFLYQTILHRDPAEWEVNEWLDEMKKKNISREDVFCMFLSSVEFHDLVI